MTNQFSWKRAISWSLYDFANSAFATTVMAGFFPLFFKQYWSTGADVTASTLKLGIANSAASMVFLFLVGYWMYIDGVHTIIRMAVDYGLSLGLDSGSLIKALLVTQFVGFPSALLFGKIGEKLGAKTGIYISIGVYILMTIWGYYLNSEAQFFGMAITIGLVQGGVPSLSRSFYTRIIPPGQAAQFFGFYNMVGKFAAVMGPALMGWIAVATGDPRKGIFAITALLVAGGVCLFFVNEADGRQTGTGGQRDHRCLECVA